MSSTISGNLHVANDVLADLVGNAAMECYGVVVNSLDEGVHVDLYIIVEYGTNIATVSRNLIDQVSFALKEYARVPLAGVDVHVMDVKVRR